MAKPSKPHSTSQGGSAAPDSHVPGAGGGVPGAGGGPERWRPGRSVAPPPDPGLIREFAEFLRENKKWWLVPIVASLLLLAALTLLTASPAAPFIYTLF